MPEHDYLSGVHSRATGKKRACRNVILKQYMEMGFMMNRCRNAFFMNSLGTRHFTKRGGPENYVLILSLRYLFSGLPKTTSEKYP